MSLDQWPESRLGQIWYRSGMLALLTGKWRKGAAAFLVALYALCVLAPTAAIASSGSSVAAQCLTNDHHGMTANQGAGDGDQHSVPAGNDLNVLAKCCGLFGVSAVAPTFDVVAMHMARASDIALPPADNLFGRSSSRIDRPPRLLLSL